MKEELLESPKELEKAPLQFDYEINHLKEYEQDNIFLNSN